MRTMVDLLEVMVLLTTKCYPGLKIATDSVAFATKAPFTRQKILDFERETDVLVILVLHAYIAVEWVP